MADVRTRASKTTLERFGFMISFGGSSLVTWAEVPVVRSLPRRAGRRANRQKGPGVETRRFGVLHPLVTRSIQKMRVSF